MRALLSMVLLCWSAPLVPAQVELGSPVKINDLSDAVKTIRLSPDERILFAGSKAFRLYVSRNLKPIGELINGEKEINDAAFSSDGQTIAVARSSSPIEFYRTSNQARTRRSEASANFWEVEFLPDNNDIIACGGQSTLYRINGDSGATIRQIQTPFRSINALLGISPARIVIAGLDSDKQAIVELRDAVSLEVIQRIHTASEPIDRMTLTRDRRTLYYSTKSGLIARWDLTAMKQTGRWVLDQSNVRDIRLFDDETKLFVGGWYRKLQALDLQTGQSQDLNIPEGRGLTAINVLANPDRVLVAPGLPKTYRFGAWPIKQVRPIEHQRDNERLQANAATPQTNENAGAKVRVVMLCPRGVRPPQNFQVGIDRLCDYTDQFVLGGIESWGIKPKTETLFLRRDGHVVVHGVVGTKPASAYTKASTHAEAITGAIRRYEIEPKHDLWWVLVYVGEPPVRFADFRGGRSPKFGGWSIANYDSRSTKLRVGMPIAGELGDSMALKGMIHELGHAFGLPHIGPRFEQRKGNTLMGPTNANFRRVKGYHEPNGYLSQASAAMLLMHPVLQETPMGSRGTHAVDASRFNARLGSNGAILMATQIRGDRSQRFAILADDRSDLPGSYWPKHYVSRVDNDGRVRFSIEKPSSVGKLRIWFVNRDGSISGKGNQQGVGAAFTFNYKIQNGTLDLAPASENGN